MKLSDEQLKAIQHINGPALTLAVPGAGKTTMLLYRTVNLINKGIDPNRIITITFSKASSLDMEKRFKNLFPNFNKSLRFSTIHAFSYRIVLQYSKLRGKNFKLIEDSSNSKYDLISKIYFSIYKKIISEETLEQIISKISYFKNSLIDPKNSKTDIPGFNQIFEAYEKYKYDNNLIDFDDMITLALNILKKDDYIRNKFKSQFDYYQLDEGQDTSLAQFELINYLAAPKNNLFIVADDDQSIYAFRGANPEYLLNLKKTYKNLSLYYLQNNFRSSKNIVTTSNLFIKNNIKRFDKNIFTSNDYLEPVNIIKVNSNKEQYSFIYEKIKSEPQKTHAIIYRNNLCSLGIVEYLERKNITFNIKGNKLKFFSHFVVKDILSIIDFSNDMGNIEKFSKFYFKIKGYISKKHIEYIKKNPGKNVFRILLNYPNLPSYYRDNIFSLMAEFKKLKNLNIHDQINVVLYDLAYDEYLRDFSKKFGFNYESLNEFSSYLKFIAKSERDLESLIGRLKHLEFLINSKSNYNTNVTLCTIHSVKGLEYDYVYVVDLVEGVLPSLKSKDEGSLEEERRLFYVAITRAKSHLYLIYPKNYNGNYSIMSSFLKEISNF
ncbi:MAG: ATP-dependent helicase [Peptoniphilaceae bacterium]